MRNQAILLMFHCKENTGYAISSLEKVFYEAALAAGYASQEIFWSYNGLAGIEGEIERNSDDYRKIHCDYKNPDPEKIEAFILKNNITQAIAFDLGYPAKIIRHLRKSGVISIISYWGASMSRINTGYKLLLKKIEYLVRRYKPDIFIFESEAMRLTATHGRGIPIARTHVIHLGVDTQKFFPNYTQEFYAHDELGIDRKRHIAFYSGHMEERKGVRVIVQAAIELSNKNEIADWHFVLCGNKGDEAKAYIDLLSNSAAKDRVTFAGYRNDIPLLMRSARAGIIASTGWDSFTMSSIEMMASGLPLIVSNLQGLGETIESGVNGFLIPPGDHFALADRLIQLSSDPTAAIAMSEKSRVRALNYFSAELQVARMANLLSGYPKE